MKTHYALFKSVSLGSFMALLLFNFAVAQDSFQEFYQKAMQTAQAGDFTKSAEIFNQCFQKHSADLIIEDFGAEGGAAFFDYARVLIAIKQWDEAKVWLSNSANADARAKELQTPIKNKNPKASQARFQLGFVEAQLGNHEEALKIYQAYKDSPKPDAEWAQTRSNFMLYQGTSLIKTGKPADGVKAITELFTNREAWRVQPQVLMQGLLVLGEGWVFQAKNAGGDANKLKEIEEQAHRFLDDNIKYLSATPFNAYRFGFVDRYKKLGFDSSNSNLYSLAIRFFSQIPTVDEIKNDFNLLLAQNNPLQPTPAAFQQFQARLTALEQAPVHPDVENYLVLASCYERLGNPTAAREIFRFLSQNYPDVPVERRAQILHEAARFATIEGDTKAAKYFGDQFFEEIPEDNPLRGNVSTFTLQSLIASRQFEEVIKVCETVRSQHEPGDSNRELADAYYPISLFALQRFADAEAPFDEYMQSHPEGGNRETVAYQRALNSIALRKHRNGADQLDDFLKEFGESDRFKEGALANLAVSRYNLQDYPTAIKVVDQLEEYKPDSVELARTLVTRGDSYMISADKLGREQKDEAASFRQKGIESYLAATRAATKAANAVPANAAFYKEVGGQSIWNAFEYYNTYDQQDKALAKYDEFFPDYKGTQFEPQISVFGIEVLEANNRGEEALKQVETVINFMGSQPAEKQDVELLQKAIGSYSEASIRIKGVEPTIETLDNFPNIDKSNQSLLTWLKIQKVIVLQGLRNKQPKESAEYKSYVNRINGVFEELSLFEKSKFPPFVLQQIGINFSRGENPFRAVPYYEELLSREDDTFKGPAVFGIAEIEMRNAGKRTSAKNRFETVLTKYKGSNPELVPQTHMNLAKIYIDEKDWKAASEQLKIINQNTSFFKRDKGKRAEAGVLWGKVLKEMGDMQGAAKSYLAITNTYLGNTEHSTEAFYQFTQIALEDIKKAPPVDDKNRAKHDREKEMYGIYLEYLYRWRELNPDKDSPTGALNSLRRSVQNFRSDLNITDADEEEIRYNLNIPADWNPAI